MKPELEDRNRSLEIQEECPATLARKFLYINRVAGIVFTDAGRGPDESLTAWMDADRRERGELCCEVRQARLTGLGAEEVYGDEDQS